MEQALAFLKDVGFSFVPLFVAIDAIAVVSLVVGLFHRATPRERARMVNISTLTAGAIGVIFLFLGRTVLDLMGIGVPSFAVGGGIVLLVLALREIVGTAPTVEEVPSREEMAEVVPIGTPLLAGPATITTLLLLSDLYGVWPVLVAFALNLAIAWVVFRQAVRVTAFLGRGGVLAIAKIMSMFLAAIAARMVLQGIQEVLANGP